MSLIDQSKIQASAKKLQGKAHTDNAKEGANEALASGVSVSAGTVFNVQPPNIPGIASLYAISNSVVEMVRLELVPDASANGHAFRARLPADYETASSNPAKGTGVFVNGQYLDQTAGKLQIVPPLYGLNYEGKPYRGGTATKGSGDLVPPGDQVDWILDYFNGVLFQENDPDTTPSDMTYVECLIWIGDFVEDSYGGGIVDTLITKITNQQFDTGQTIIDTVPVAQQTMAEWMVTATLGTALFATKLLGVTHDDQVSYTNYGILDVNDPAPAFCQVSLDYSAGNMRLLASTDQDNVDIKITRINVTTA